MLMDFDTSFRRPLEIVIDYTRPVDVVNISGGYGNSKVVSHGGPQNQPPEIPNVSGVSPPPTGSYRHGGPPASSETPRRPITQATTYTILDIPVSTCKAVRIGCWPSSPIDSDALKGEIYPNFLQSLKYGSVCVPSEFPQVFVSGAPKPTAPTSGGLTRIEPLKTSVYECPIAPIVDMDALVSKLIEREKKLGIPLPLQEQCPYADEGTRYCNDPTLIVPALKKDLKNCELRFKSQYNYGTMEYRHCITANNSYGWKQESSGIIWAGVYGIDDICVVTLSGHVDMKRVHGFLASFDPKFVLSSFRKCVLSELEDLAVPPCKLSEEFDGGFDLPFCVVSETPMPDESGHETSSAGHVPEAVAFVQRSGLLEQAKDSGGAIKLAIFAFQCLMGKKFEAKEIEVTVLFGRKFGTGYTRDLDICQVGDYLAAVESIMG